jgi:hypothetical protein
MLSILFNSKVRNDFDNVNCISSDTSLKNVNAYVCKDLYMYVGAVAEDFVVVIVLGQKKERCGIVDMLLMVDFGAVKDFDFCCCCLMIVDLSSSKSSSMSSSSKTLSCVFVSMRLCDADDGGVSVSIAKSDDDLF